MRFGRKRPTTRHYHLKLVDYMPALPIARPASTDYASNASAALGQMYLNDTLGDCVVATVGHLIGTFTGNADDPPGGTVLPDSEIEAAYSTICGYVPGNSATDTGCDIQKVLQYWANPGFVDPDGEPVHDIVGIIDIDPTNIAEVETAIYLFENLVLGMELPDAWTTPLPSASGFIWDVAGAPNIDNGHCVPAIDYNGKAVKIATWAMTGSVTYAALAKYAAAVNNGECYVVLSQDMINEAQLKAPNGLNWTQLQSDFSNVITGAIPMATPVTVTVGHTVTCGISYNDQNGNPMLVAPAPDAPPAWTNTTPATETLAASADGSSCVATAVAAGADTITLALAVGGVAFTDSLGVTVSPAPQVLTSVAITTTVAARGKAAVKK